MTTTDNKLLNIGRTYKHFKGGKYIVYYVSTDIETNVPYVNYGDYKPRFEGKWLYSRPINMFLGKVNGENRFNLVHDKTGNKKSINMNKSHDGIKYYDYNNNRYIILGYTIDTETNDTIIQMFDPKDGINGETRLPNKIYCIHKQNNNCKL